MSKADDLSLPLAERIAAAGPSGLIHVTKEEFVYLGDRSAVVQPGDVIRILAEPPSDLDRLKALFDSVGVRYRFDQCPDGATIIIDLQSCECGCVFLFGPSGKFVSHGVWE